ncbi:receptor-like cytosolic serine/threonine-protein kinase RBK2 [Alnus glutinosa]|uniref:receptor-like cytosolic serine/threonine-protein kinase RBK2 n=1 Tax=Alnus glutinosa TaxID=3517 RepID=UPI002D795C5B|nr:receptor-like cytosolic serine/threonine-protein kinase RBK2 [Alnus glutinosa]
MKKKVDLSPVGVLEDYFKSSKSETCSSKEHDIDSKDSKSESRRQWHGFVQLLRTGSKKSLATLHPLSVMKLSRRMSRSMREATARMTNFHVDIAKLSWKNFTLHELQTATNYFSPEHLIGKGGYAEVYKGCLRDGQLVAIKRLTRGTADEIVGDFLSELGIIAHLNHPNTIKLIGYGVEGGMHLVLELSLHGSLASRLYGSKRKLEWGIRYKIALGTAKGLLYLHEGCQKRIIHRDIKAANILLKNDLEPQICDFGLAKWLPEQWTHHTVSKFEGTFGYLAPEYLLHGIVDEKTDVFAFGVLLLELVTGRRALDYNDYSKQSLVLWAKPLLKKNDIMNLTDPFLADNYDSRQMNLVLLVASLCIQQSSIRRPCMSQVLRLLNGDLSHLKCMKKCQTGFFRKAFRDELVSAEECNSTKN